MNFKECASTTKNKIITVNELGRKFAVLNDSNRAVTTIKVDNCLYNGNEIKCGYLFELNDNKRIIIAIYVELKGKDINHGVEQLKAALNRLRDRHRQVERMCRIVASRVPKAGPKVQKIKANFYKRTNVPICISTKQKFIHI